MPTEYATITAQVTEHGSALGVDVTLTAKPLTTNGLLSYLDDPEHLSVGAQTAQANSDGSVAILIPINTFPVAPPWAFSMQVRGSTGSTRSIPLGTFEITADAALTDLVNLDVTAVTPDIVDNLATIVANVAAEADRAETAADAAEAVGTTNDTVIAGRINTPGSATKVALTTATADQAVGRLVATKHAPALGLYFPEAEGTVGSGNDTSVIDAAIVTCAAAGGGRVVLNPLKTYSVDYVHLRTGVTLDGVHRSAVKARIAHRDGATEPMVSLLDNTQTDTGLINMCLNGRSATQATAVDGVHISHAGGVVGILPKHRLDNLHIRSVKGDGLVTGDFVRSSEFTRISIYAADGYGWRSTAADSKASEIDVAQSGKAGVYLLGASMQLDNIKSWYSGRIDGTSPGFWISGSAHHMTNMYSQENKGHGFLIFRSGTPLTGLFLTFTSDSDNTAATTGAGLNMGRVINSVIVGTVKSTAGLAGTVSNGMQLDSLSDGNEISLGVSGQTSWHIDGAGVSGVDSGKNSIRINGREGRVVVQTFSGSITLGSPYLARTYRISVTANATINNPGKKPSGFAQRIIFKGDAVAERTVTFASDWQLKTGTTVAVPINATVVVDFLCDGTNWVQV